MKKKKKKYVRDVKFFVLMFQCAKERSYFYLNSCILHEMDLFIYFLLFFYDSHVVPIDSEWIYAK